MLNNLDDYIKFTMEKHTDKLPFLDIIVMKNEDGTISTDIFYKTTTSLFRLQKLPQTSCQDKCTLQFIQEVMSSCFRQRSPGL